MEIANFGIPGANSGIVLDSEVPATIEFRPTLAILLVGTNDACNSGALVEPDEFGRNLVAISAALRGGGGTELVMVSPPPVCVDLLLKRHDPAAYGASGPAERLERIVDVLAEKARESGAAYLDLRPHFLARDLHGDDSYLIRFNERTGAADGVHPNQEGYRLIARLLDGIINENGYDTSRIACLGDSITYGVHMPGAGSAGGGTYPGLLRDALRNPE